MSEDLEKYAQDKDAQGEDARLKAILKTRGVIAVVGLSANPERPSHDVFLDLIAHGFPAVGVNPGLAGTTLAGAPIYARLADVPGPFGIVDVFRNSADAAGVVDEALALPALPHAIWLQLGVRNDAARAKAEAGGVKIVMDRCIKIEIARLGIKPR